MFKSIGSTWLVNLLQIGVLMFLTPYVIRTLGKEQNGLWVEIVSLTGVLSLFILGVPMASVRFITEHVAKKDVEGANRAIATCLGIAVFLGACALVIGIALYFVFDAFYLRGTQGAHLPAAMHDGARIAFALVVAQVVFGFALRLPYAIFDAHDDFVTRNWVLAGELLLRLGTTWGLLHWRAELPMLALVQIASMVFEFALLRWLIHTRFPGIRFHVRGFDRSLMRRILGFSVFAMLLNVGTLLAFRADAIVIGLFLPAMQATYFDAGNKFFDPLTQLLISVGAVVMPMATRSSTTGELKELGHVFLKWSKVCLTLVLMVGLYLAVLGPRFLGAWLGPEFEASSGSVLVVLMLSFFFYLPVRGVGLPLLMGLGKPRFPALALLVMGLVNVVISLALVRSLGILGVALGTAIPNVLFAGAVLWRACKETGVALSEWLGYVVVRAVIGACVPLALLFALLEWVDVRGFVSLLASGAAMVVVFAVVWVLFVYRGDRYLDLHAALTRKLAHAKPRGPDGRTAP